LKVPCIMRIRYRKKSKLSIQRIGAVVGLLIPIAVLGAIAGQVVTVFNAIPSFGTSDSLKPDPSTFLIANYTRLAQMASFYDYRFEQYHIPNNFTVSTVFMPLSNTTVNYYGFSDNGALFTGSSLVAFVGKYLAAVKNDNATMKIDAIRVIRKLVSGMAMMLAVPNGGLGGQYGAIIARSWAAPWQKNNATFRVSGLFTVSNKKCANGTGPYSQYRWSDDTSNDEYAGYYMGVAITFKYVSAADAQDVHTMLALMIDQLCAGMLRTNFLGIGDNGQPTGVDQKMKFFQGTWMLLVLKMGALAFPDKYEATYEHQAFDEQNVDVADKESGTQEIVSNYYAFNFGIDICFALVMLEDNPVILQRYLKNFENSLWFCVRYHRNPYFDAIYLAMEKKQYSEDQFVERDVEDQLMEFDIDHFPDIHKNPVLAPSSYQIVNFSKYQVFFQNNSIGTLFGPVFEEFQLNTSSYFDHPLTVKEKKTGIFMWDANPFNVQENKDNNNPTNEEPGMSFTAPYYIMLGFIGMPENGVRSAWSG